MTDDDTSPRSSSSHMDEFPASGRELSEESPQAGVEKAANKKAANKKAANKKAANKKAANKKAANKKASEKQAAEKRESLVERKPLYFLMGLVLAVVVIAAAVIVFQKWWNNRPGPDPASVQITAVVGERSEEISPYQTCAFGEDCVEQGKVSRISVNPDQTLEITVPSVVQRADVSVLAIYDDPAANDENIISASEKKEISVPGSRGTAQLQLVEIKSVLLGTDAQGEETPVSVVWSLRTGDQPLSTPETGKKTPTTDRVQQQ